MFWQTLIFGTLVESGALGCTWAVNARENKLTPWFNDTRTGNRGELLFLRVKNEVYDLIQGARAEFRPAWRFGAAGRAKSKRLLRCCAGYWNAENSAKVGIL